MAAVRYLKKHLELVDERKFQYQGIFLCVLIALTLVLAVARVVMANVLVDQSVEVASIETKIEILNDQTEKIAAQIRSESSISALNTRAQLDGFTRVNSFSYIPRPQNVAARIDFTSP